MSSQSITPPSSPSLRSRSRAPPGAPRKVSHAPAIVDFTMLEARAALRNAKPYVPVGMEGAAYVAPAWEMPELGPNDLAFVAGESLVIAAYGRVPVLCPQADSVACFSADQEEIVFSMRNKMVHELCGPSKSPESFAVFVLSADHSTMERVADGEKIRERRNVAAVFIVEDYGAPSQ